MAGEVVPRQCTARSKRSGERCRRAPVRGAGVCWHHGGAAPQVQRKAAERLALRQLAADLERADPGDSLVDALSATRVVVAQLRQALDDPRRDHEWFEVLGSWLDRLGRLSKAALDAGLAERQVRIAEQQAKIITGLINSIVGALGHDPRDPLVAGIIRDRLLALSAPSSAAAPRVRVIEGRVE